MDERLMRAGELYERAVFGGDSAALADADRVLDGVEADLALARGRVVHARFLDKRVEEPDELMFFERAAELYRRLGDERGEADALFWVGTFYQVVRDDHVTALPSLERARALATSAGDSLTLSYVLRHIGFAEQAAGRTAATRDLFLESTRLRREVGFHAGVAANLVGLAYLAAGEDEPDTAGRHLDEAAAIAIECGADGVLRWVEQARTQIVPR
jgi:nucleotide-binding universal stress UspA family protein